MSCIHVIQVKEHFENSGYTSDGVPVDVQVTSDEIIPVTVQSVTTGWSVEQLKVYSYYILTVQCITISIISLD